MRKKTLFCSILRFTNKNRLRHRKRTRCLWIKTMLCSKLWCMLVIVTNTSRSQGSWMWLNFGALDFLKLLQEKAALDQKKSIAKSFCYIYFGENLHNHFRLSRVWDTNSNLFRSFSFALQVLSAYRIFSQHISGYEFALQNAINCISWGLTFELYNNWFTMEWIGSIDRY
jgi:hypothetical protein